MIKKIWAKIAEWFVDLVAMVKWEQKSPLLPTDIAQLRSLLTKDYYIIATRRSNFLSCFFINLGHFLLTGRWGFYTHVLMNMEDEVHSDDDFRLIEAATTGTHFTTFDHVAGNCDAIALIKVKGVSIEEWTAMMDDVKKYLGRPYDTLFDIKNDQKISCVELVRLALIALPDYDKRFAHFEQYISRKKNLTPQMFLESSEFEVVWEARR